MTWLGGHYYDRDELPPHCPYCRATDGGHEPGCRDWTPRAEQYKPEPCDEDCELRSGIADAVCTCGNADRCPDCDGWGATARGPYDEPCAGCEGRGRL